MLLLFNELMFNCGVFVGLNTLTRGVFMRC